MDAGGDVGPPEGATGVDVLGLLVDEVVVAGGNVVTARWGVRWCSDCGLGDDEHAAATTVRRASDPNTTSFRRAAIALTRRRLS